MDWINILSTAAIVIFIVSALPQVWKLFRHKTAKDISAWMSVLIAVGNLLGLVRAVWIHDLYFSINYAFQLALWLIILGLIVRYRGNN